MSITYKNSGVDIEAGEQTVKMIKPLVRSTFNDKVLTDIGLFGGFYDGKFEGYEHPVLVASTDGVGTKLKIAFMTGIHNTIGQCLVNHCTNDILCCGAKPLFFLDYFGCGKLEPNVAYDVIEGFVTACKENGCSLIGGETAEMPSFYADGEYDVSGTIVGVVDKNSIVDGKKLVPGDILIGLPSTGLHTNGYSLARNVLLNQFKVDDYIDELGETIGQALLKVHKSYLHEVQPFLAKNFIKGISHITGGGIIGNTKRILPEGCQLKINWSSWNVLPIFNLIQKTGNIEDDEMRHVFNMGVGMILVADKNSVNEILSMGTAPGAFVMGEIE
jgi:phosphoribosylformylglycinamidine cyclo-ligase